MSAHCDSDCTEKKKYRCPVNGKEYASVGIKTILHHVAKPWQKDLTSKGYYFCSDKDCDVVYFGQDDSVILKSELRTKVGIKETVPDRTICYCFGVSGTTAREKIALDFVKDKTRQALCSCETSNPSGRCCLKDFPGQ
jgi:hypothetical protein